MTIEEARLILGDSCDEKGGLYSLGWYLAWNPGATTATLDGGFTADDLEAIATFMRHGRIAKENGTPSQAGNKP